MYISDTVKYKTKALGRFGFSCNGLTSHESSPDVGGWELRCVLGEENRSHDLNASALRAIPIC